MAPRNMILLLLLILTGCYDSGKCNSQHLLWSKTWRQMAAPEQVLDGVNINRKCSDDLVTALRDLTALTTRNISIPSHGLYALTMFDATGKLPPSGISLGNMKSMGSLPLCHRVQVDGSTTPISGRYCVLIIGGLVNTFSSIPARQVHRTNAGGPSGHGVSLSVGLCVPDSCNARDIQQSLDSLLSYLETSNINRSSIHEDGVGLHVGNCHCMERDMEYTLGEIAFIIVASILVILILVGTLYDVVLRAKCEFDRGKIESVEIATNEHGENSSNTQHPVTANLPHNRQAARNVLAESFLCFSIIGNSESILDTRQPGKAITCLNGIRAISMFWVILGHTASFMTMGAIENVLSAYEIVTRFTGQAIMQALFSMDSFFFLSGCLVSYLTILKLHQTGSNVKLWLTYYLHRVIRLTPTYMFVIFYFSTIDRKTSNGAISLLNRDAMEDGRSKCHNYWWTNMLYINNLYLKTLGQQCMGWGWYVAVDTQMYFCSPIFIYLLYKFPRVGKVVTLLSVAGFSVVLGMYALHYDLTPNWINSGTIGGDMVYIKPWNRYAVYLVGIWAGAVLAKRAQSGVTERSLSSFGNCQNKTVTLTCWTLCTAIMLTLVYRPHGWTQHDGQIELGRDISQAETVTWFVFFRTVWAACLGWVVYACHTGRGGFINRILSWSPWTVLSKLTFCAYLLHPIIQWNYIHNLNDTINFTDYTFSYHFIGFVIITYAASFVVSVMVEVPTSRLERLILPTR